MKTLPLKEAKQELASREKKQLVEIITRLARSKKENKELLEYLLYYKDEPLEYMKIVKDEIKEVLAGTSDHYYYSTKSFRKILRMITKYSRFTTSKQGETELLLYFMEEYINRVDRKISYKPSLHLFIRAMEKVKKLIPVLHEDLQYDYEKEHKQLLENAQSKFSYLR